MKIGDRVFIKGIVDEIRKDVVIIKNEGGYFGTVPGEIIDKETTVSVLPDENGYYPNVCGMCANAESELCERCGSNKNFKKAQTKIPDFYKKYAEQEPTEPLYRLITDNDNLMLLEDYKTGVRTVIEKRIVPCDDVVSR